MKVEELKAKAIQIREEVIDYGYLLGKCHMGGALSTIEILTALYYEEMKIDPKNPLLEDRDRFILSKGHGALGLYTILGDLGFFPKEYLKTFKKMGSILQGHPNAAMTPGIEMTAGSLGQGISYGAGKALALKAKGINGKVFVMVGDGELQEGQNWEAIACAHHYNLSQLYVIVDHNKLQLDDTLINELTYCKIKEKFISFGWNAKSVDGHDIEEILDSLNDQDTEKPTAIIAHTIKGKGVSFMENDISWHCNQMSAPQYQTAKKEIKASKEAMG
ncbi:MAG: transketolase [Clostridia bacterium]|nr:transketolase [Clostridia bacterium]